MLWRAWADASYRKGSAGLACLMVTPEGRTVYHARQATAGSSVEAERRAVELAGQCLRVQGALQAVVFSDCQAAVRDAVLPPGYRARYARDGRIIEVDRLAERVRQGRAFLPQARPFPQGLLLLMADGRPRSFDEVASALPFRHRSLSERRRLALDLLLDNLDLLAWAEGGILLKACASPGALAGDLLAQRLVEAAGLQGGRGLRRLLAVFRSRSALWRAVDEVGPAPALQPEAPGGGFLG